MQNPVYEQEKEEQIHTSRLVPIYWLTANLTQKMIRYLTSVPAPTGGIAGRAVAADVDTTVCIQEAFQCLHSAG